MEGWYYLHTNGSLIYKRELGGTAADIRESTFAKAMWPFDPNDREGVWRIVIESLAAGAERERVHYLANHWGCDDVDADVYADRVGVTLSPDGGKWCATGPGFRNLATSLAGFGKTKLEAMAELCSAMGYRPSKMWGTSFEKLLRQ